MKLKLDENLRPEIGDLFRERGHEVSSVYDQGLRGHEDPEIIDVCRAEGRILLTMDLDFSDIRMYSPAGYPGLIVLRLRSKGRTSVLRVVTQVLAHLNTEPIAGRLWIVDAQRIRIHRVEPAPGDSTSPSEP
jgi:predicted nuclease of predicted toxin-antitoxin system